jgi:hypothetical protein
MKKSSFILVILSLIIIVAVLTNPDQDRHKEIIKNKLLTSLQKSMKQNQTQIKDDWEEAGQALGIILGGVIIDGLLNNLMSTDNYVLFSTTKITWDGERKIIGIGALGTFF